MQLRRILSVWFLITLLVPVGVAFAVLPWDDGDQSGWELFRARWEASDVDAVFLVLLAGIAVGLVAVLLLATGHEAGGWRVTLTAGLLVSGACVWMLADDADPNRLGNGFWVILAGGGLIMLGGLFSLIRRSRSPMSFVDEGEFADTMLVTKEEENLLYQRGSPVEHKAYLVRLDTGERVLLAAEQTAIGRNAFANDIVINAPDVSREHALIYARDDRYILYDRAAKSGTFLNDRRVNGPQPLVPGDRIRIGPVTYEFMVD